MRVSGLDSNDDWVFGKGKASYKVQSKAVLQSIRTRLKSFTDDWFLNIEDGIDWITLMGSKGNEERINREIEKTILQTEGVVAIINFNTILTDRDLSIKIKFIDVYSEIIDELLEIAL